MIALMTDMNARLKWEDEQHVAYLAEGYSFDDAWTLVAFDWSQMTGEDFNEM